MIYSFLNITTMKKLILLLAIVCTTGMASCTKQAATAIGASAANGALQGAAASAAAGTDIKQGAINGAIQGAVTGATTQAVSSAVSQ